MAAHLETVRDAKAVVNFSPVLIEQLLDYPQRIQKLLESGTSSGDFLLDALFDMDRVDPRELLVQTLRVNEDRVPARFPHYARLFEKAKRALANDEVLPTHESSDLLVWYLIVWLGESLRDAPLVTQLVEQESGYSEAERLQLLSFIAEVTGSLLPRYRQLADDGNAELSVTPHSHPVLPLLLDFGSAREAMPDAPLPLENYPGGEARCDWHLTEARRVFREVFGTEPSGCWPSEGSISQATMDMLGRHHFRWTASGSQVLNNSLARIESPQPAHPHLNAWQTRGEGHPVCFFRDDGMSDLIGFEYSPWPAGSAVDDFISRIEQQHHESVRSGNTAPVLSIIMDGENAWEYFDQNGWAFLQGLYRRLADHPNIRLTTFSEVLERVEPRPLTTLCAGSWVYGTFSTWVGSPAKNHAWDVLVRAKRAVDAALGPDFDEHQSGWVSDVLRQLAVCEASDWFWWLRDDDQTVDEAAFDGLFRRQLEVLYGTIGMAPPDVADQPIAGPRPGVSSSTDASGTMRRSS